jgi:hypothetical protein
MHSVTFRVILFGAGAAGRQALRLFSPRVEVLAVADNDPRKHGTTFMGYPVIAASDILSRSYDCIVVASVYAHEIEKQLLVLGVNGADIEFPPPTATGVSHAPWKAVQLWTAGLGLAASAICVVWFW